MSRSRQSITRVSPLVAGLRRTFARLRASSPYYKVATTLHTSNLNKGQVISKSDVVDVKPVECMRCHVLTEYTLSCFGKLLIGKTLIEGTNIKSRQSTKVPIVEVKYYVPRFSTGQICRACRNIVAEADTVRHKAWVEDHKVCKACSHSMILTSSGDWYCDTCSKTLSFQPIWQPLQDSKPFSINRYPQVKITKEASSHGSGPLDDCGRPIPKELRTTKGFIMWVKMSEWLRLPKRGLYSWELQIGP